MANPVIDLRDLILRPSRLLPGVYQMDGSPAPFTVIDHHGRNYELIWCGAGEGYKLAQPGDTVFERAFIRDQTVTYPRDALEEVPIKAREPLIVNVPTALSLVKRSFAAEKTVSKPKRVKKPVRKPARRRPR